MFSQLAKSRVPRRCRGYSNRLFGHLHNQARFSGYEILKSRLSIGGSEIIANETCSQIWWNLVRRFGYNRDQRDIAMAHRSERKLLVTFMSRGALSQPSIDFLANSFWNGNERRESALRSFPVFTRSSTSSIHGYPFFLLFLQQCCFRDAGSDIEFSALRGVI
jgi:hypothetical protein